MNRRRFVFAAVAFTLLSTTAARADYVDTIVTRLGKEGFDDIRVMRTLLGRVRIVAEKGGRSRELVCNPRTGEILRDIWIDTGDDAEAAFGQSNTNNGSKARDDGDHEDSGDDDDGHDDEGGDDGEDNSGHGSNSDDDHGGDDDKSGHGGDDD